MARTGGAKARARVARERKAREQRLKDAGLKPVRGAFGKTFWIPEA